MFFGGLNMSKINMTTFFCEAITTERKNFKKIDNIYKLNKYEFYRLAKQSSEYNSIIISDSDFLKEEYNKKLLGIVIYIQNTQDQSLIVKVLDIIRDSYSYTFSYFLKNKSIVDFDDFITRYVKKKRGMDNITDDEINSNFIILHMLSIWNNREIAQNKCYNMYINAINERYKNDYKINYSKISNDNLIKIKTFYNQFKIKNRSDILKRYNNNDSNNMIAYLFDFEEITTSLFDYIELNKRDVEEIIYITMLFDDKTNIDNIIMLVYFRYMIKAYKQMKIHYFENNKETMYIDIDFIQGQLNAANNSINNKNSEIEELKKELSKKEKEIKKLNNELNDNQINKDELISLRDNFFNIELGEEKIIQNEIDYDALSEKKYMVLGGHDTLQNKLKDILLSSVFIHTDNLNFDTNIINTVDKIVVFPNYLNHSIYYKVMGEARKLNKSVVHISNTNIDLILNQI
jgi:hypothetical protein